ncbi:MAG TPA: dihydrofolate reductase family protein [Solirubrobacterales bacterium]|nr:dihydrofolate reductase family protein [Solirubrobacterales bacterium]
MGNVRTANISVSLDGYSAGPEQSKDNPLGIGGERLHDWVVALAAWREEHGKEGGEVNESSAVVERWQANVGATIMGRNMFGGGPGPWGDDPWEGWWGPEPPFGHPVFVLTHHEREPFTQGQTTYHFVTDGIEPALELAREAAGEGDVTIAGGARTVQQYIAARLLDEIDISIVPIFLGGGTRLFDNLGDTTPQLELIEAVAAPGVTHARYKVG